MSESPSGSQQEIYLDMRECLTGFSDGSVRLSDVIDRLPELLKRLDGADEEWREQYVEYWWTLENIHGEAIELGESRRMPPDTRKTVDDAVIGLNHLVDSALSAKSS